MVGAWLGEMKFLKIKDKHLCEYSSKPGKPGDLQGQKKSQKCQLLLKIKEMFLLYHVVITVSIYSTSMFSLVLWNL